MEPIALSIRGESVHLEGFPHAVKLAALTGPKAARLADLALHRADLNFASACLEAMNRTTDQAIRSALWRCAIIYYAKCFDQSASRAQLSAKKVFSGCEQITFTVHKYFENFRDKNLVHDENAFSQCTPAAVINAPGESCKVAKVVCMTATFDILSQESYANLASLVGRVNEWLGAQCDALCDVLTRELEGERYEDLLARGDVQHRAPGANEMGEARAKAP